MSAEVPPRTQSPATNSDGPLVPGEAVASASDSDSPSPRRRGIRALGLLEAYALVGVTALVFLFFSFYSSTSETFPTMSNVQIVLGTQSVLAVIAIGALVPLICQQWDLSVGAAAGLSAVVTAKLLSGDASIPLAICAGIGVGSLVGVVNAVLITRLGTNSIITTLGTAGIIGGVVAQTTGGVAQVSNIPASFASFGSDTFLGLPRTFYVLLIIALLIYYLLVHTPFGRYVYAFGSSEEAARLVGLRTKLVLASTFIVSGTLAGIAGVLQVARSGGADPRIGELFTLPALAAAFLSAAAIRPGRYNVGGVLVAIFLLAFLNSGLNLAGAQPYISQYVNGVALIVGVALAVYLGRKRTGTEA
jgi:ribose transport system permease protein